MNALYSLNERFEVVTTDMFLEAKALSENVYIDELRDEVRFVNGDIGVLVKEQSGSSFVVCVYSEKTDNDETLEVPADKFIECLQGFFTNFK